MFRSCWGSLRLTLFFQRLVPGKIKYVGIAETNYVKLGKPGVLTLANTL